MSVAAAVLDFCARVYEETCAVPSTIVLAPVSFDTLRAELAPTMRYDDGTEGDWPEEPKVFVDTGHGHLVIRRGR